MSINVTSPVTGAAVTGLTSPTFTVVADSVPGVTKSWYVAALGGTQTGVTAHSIASPFTVSWKNPVALVSPGVVDATGVLRSPIRRNRYEMIVRKGGVPLPGQAARLNVIRIQFEVEAGVETNDRAQILAMLSCAFGAANQQVLTGFADTLTTGAA